MIINYCTRNNKNGYAHILNTKTGYPAKSNLLSASVSTLLDCADVDGYATTLIAFGLDKSKEFLKNHQELKAFLIYIDKNGVMKTYQTESFNHLFSKSLTALLNQINNYV